MQLERTQTFGKLEQVQPEVGSCTSSPSPRLQVTDIASGLRFLVDTGASVSVLPRRCVKSVSANSSEYTLYAANGTPIKTYGNKTLVLNIKLRRPYRWTFVVADVNQPILGADFLNHHRLVVDINDKKLIDKVTMLGTIGSIVRSDMFSCIKSVDINNEFHSIVQNFPDLLKPATYKDTPKHAVLHHIETSGPPVFARARPLPPGRYEIVKKEFQTMTELGICRPSNSSWASPLHVVPKKNGEIRACGDYRKLNSITTPDLYPIPRLHDFTYLLANKNFFSCLDINRAYHNIPVVNEDIEKTAIITPFGLYEFPRMTFGLRNAAQTFQRFMTHTVLQNLSYVFVYIDDILIASDSKEQHKEHLNEVFERLNKYGITININKCRFAESKIEFLGHEVSTDGIRPLQEKVRAICEYPLPVTIKDLRKYLGMLNFYRCHLPNAAEQQAPLCRYLHRSRKNDRTKIEWTTETTDAFFKCRESLKNAALLSYPKSNGTLALMTDASNIGIGAVLQQKENGSWKPLGYFSKKLTDRQKKYSAYDRELLAIYASIVYFRKMFEGRPLTIFTDHKPLVHAFKKIGSNKEIPRRTNQLLFISEFTTDIQHISGTKNSMADALSRVETIICPSIIDYLALADSQVLDAELLRFINNADETSSQIKKIFMPEINKHIYCEVGTNKIRPYVTLGFRKLVFEMVHNISHPGIRATRKLIQERFFWPSMNRDVGMFAKTCIQCQRSKTTRHSISKLEQFPQAGRFEHVHIDIVGPLPTSQEGYRYCVTMIDRGTRWPEAFPVSEITADVVARVVYSGWISRYGAPVRLTSDQGRQFESGLFTQLMKLMGIEKLRTTPYHPQSNGLVERWHRSLKTSLMARLGSTTSWVDELPTVMLGLRAAGRTDSNVSAAELTFGKTLRLPGDFYGQDSEDFSSDYDVIQKIRNAIRNCKSLPAEARDSRTLFLHKDLKNCSHVFVRDDRIKRSLKPPYDGPYLVLKRSPKVFLIQLPGRQLSISVDRLKPAYVLAESDPEMTNTSDVVTRSGRIVRPPKRFVHYLDSK